MIDTPFPIDFKSHVKVIFKRLFRVYAHVYYSHFEEVTKMEAEAHLNTCFKHFIYFSLEFKLISKSELKPLAKVKEIQNHIFIFSNIIHH